MDVLIINNSSYDLLYNLFHKTPSATMKGWIMAPFFADSRLLIATANRENLARWSDGYLQFLFHKGQSPRYCPRSTRNSASKERSSLKRATTGNP
ncbi:MAG: hypothetical protein MZV70_66995 [Desulfobacterales bacterium]|nr:hypothetical protein [Desulfobacterales bacterium]